MTENHDINKIQTSISDRLDELSEAEAHFTSVTRHARNLHREVQVLQREAEEYDNLTEAEQEHWEAQREILREENRSMLNIVKKTKRYRDRVEKRVENMQDEVGEVYEEVTVELGEIEDQEEDEMGDMMSAEGVSGMQQMASQALDVGGSSVMPGPSHASSARDNTPVSDDDDARTVDLEGPYPGTEDHRRTPPWRRAPSLAINTPSSLPTGRRTTALVATPTQPTNPPSTTAPPHPPDPMEERARRWRARDYPRQGSFHMHYAPLSRLDPTYDPYAAFPPPWPTGPNLLPRRFPGHLRPPVLPAVVPEDDPLAEKWLEGILEAKRRRDEGV